MPIKNDSIAPLRRDIFGKLLGHLGSVEDCNAALDMLSDVQRDVERLRDRSREWVYQWFGEFIRIPGALEVIGRIDFLTPTAGIVCGDRGASFDGFRFSVAGGDCFEYQSREYDIGERRVLVTFPDGDEVEELDDFAPSAVIGGILAGPDEVTDAKLAAMRWDMIKDKPPHAAVAHMLDHCRD